MTSTQPTSNFPDWKSLTGTTLDGGYELKEIVEAEPGRATLRVRVLGDYTLHALARFYVVERAVAQEQVSIWQAVHWIERKNHLSTPIGAGRLLLNGFTFAYLVFEVPDETLADVIRARTLQPEEAMEVLRSAAQGLSTLHAAGFVHGSMAPEEILAVGDSVQCSTEGVRRTNVAPLLNRKPARYLAPESTAQNVSVSSDIWCLGATLFEAVTQKKYETGLFEEAENLKHPFGVLAACCLEPDPEKRCKLADLDRISRSAPPPPKPKPVIVPVQESVLESAVGKVMANAAAAGAAGSPVNRVAEADSATEKVTFVPQRHASQAGANGSGIAKPSADALATGAGVSPGKTAAGTVAPSPVSRPITPQPDAPAAARAEFAGSHSAATSIPLGDEGTRQARTERDPSYRQTAREWLEGGHAKEDGDRTSVRRGWIYALVGFAAIFLLLWSFRSHPRRVTPAPTTTSNSSATAPPASTSTSSAQTAWPTKTLMPDAKPSARAANKQPSAATNVPPATTSSAASGQPRNIWRVVLYTYNRQQDAETKAHDLSAKRSDLHTEAFAPNGTGGPFLVVAGGQMNRQEASRIRVKALHEGMPHDSYIQNYSK